ncbi:hypothetical protein NL676_001485 [Syzygium grande]|nr:hypothetical protein NL676_001485 [Syzygium grande]
MDGAGGGGGDAVGGVPEREEAAPADEGRARAAGEARVLRRSRRRHGRAGASGAVDLDPEGRRPDSVPLHRDGPALAVPRGQVSARSLAEKGGTSS